MNRESFEGGVILGPDGHDVRTPEQIVMGMERMLIPHEVINVLPQIRRTFDPEALQELADSIPLQEVRQNTAQYRLLNSLTVNVLTEEKAREYLEAFNLSEPDLEDVAFENLTPWETPEGTRYAIHVAGERRYRAGPIRVEQDWGRSIPIQWDCSVLRDESYAVALPLQFIENNARRNVSKVEEANAIMKYFAFMRETNPKFSKAACARGFSVPVSRVTDAETFTGYPACMQSLAEKYGYRTIVDAQTVYSLWLQFHGNKVSNSDKTVEDYLAESPASDGRALFASMEELATYETETSLLEIQASKLRRKMNPRAKKVDLDSIQVGLESLIREDDLFGGYGTDIINAIAEVKAGVDDDHGPMMRRELAVAALYDQTVESLRLLDTVGALQPDRKRRLAAFAMVKSTEPIDESRDG